MNAIAFVAILFVSSLTVIAIVGSKSNARFIILVRERHPDLYQALGSPSPWANTSLRDGIRWQRMVFSKKLTLSDEAEAARIYHRRLTIVILLVLFAETALMALVLS